MSAPRGVTLPPAACCGVCRHFNGRERDLEAAFPGLASLSSAYAAVRSQDGLCSVHDRYVTAPSNCASFTPAADHISPVSVS